ncbi:GNAT family N-acetyltransferase [Roseobacter ponti]|uniref:L-ornithine N(alpha)-acyltransferase n=1 Tax=Roseobacter ponti TaxID=1891787 RepID=A0A858SQN0_9RHOB|nr:GNAT family N-acyltransferase [Roseobacter ponti]QJF50975.1 GNAT family N-acetyltransferase [Roseobacter ponti]
MCELIRGHLKARRAADAHDLARARALRLAAFGAAGAGTNDVFDEQCTQILIEDMHSGDLLCCFRLMQLTPDALTRCYSAQFYELSTLSLQEGPMIELGRFCTAPGLRDPDVLRLAWAWITRHVDEAGVTLLFGCASFSGTQTTEYLDTFAMLRARHLAPDRWLPRVKAPEVFRFAARLRRKPDIRKAMTRMPPLLRSYLMMGAWVSDHAVVDRQMNTLHVFTGVEIGAIPPARKRLLRAIA